jgi:hypothetical protein
MPEMRKIFLSLTTALILVSSFTANAVLNMGGKTIFTGTLIEVLEPGSATQIQSIITNISDATATKPYLIHLGPGVYDLGSTRIIMKEWISIQGSGQEATKITGAVSTGGYDATSAIVSGVNNASLTNLTIENTGGGGSSSIAIFNDSASPRIERVTAIVSSGTGANYGVYNTSSSPTMTYVTASASGGSNGNIGVYNQTSSSPTMTNVTASASGGAGNNHGVYNYTSSSPTMTYVTASASGGQLSYGVYNTSSSPTMTNVTATGSGGSNSSFGVFANNSAPFIQDSVLEGDTYGLIIASTSTGARITNTKIIGGVNDLTGTTNCRGNYKADLTDQAC